MEETASPRASSDPRQVSSSVLENGSPRSVIQAKNSAKAATYACLVFSDVRVARTAPMNHSAEGHLPRPSAEGLMRRAAAVTGRERRDALPATSEKRGPNRGYTRLAAMARNRISLFSSGLGTSLIN